MLSESAPPVVVCFSLNVLSQPIQLCGFTLYYRMRAAHGVLLHLFAVILAPYFVHFCDSWTALGYTRSRCGQLVTNDIAGAVVIGFAVLGWAGGASVRTDVHHGDLE